MTVDFKIKDFFFDKEKVKKALDDGTRKALSKIGAFVRQRAKSSIRRRKGISAPGSPPSSHTGDLKNKILFGYDPTNKSVVIGPVRFRRGVAPPLLEFGGTARLVSRRGEAKTVIYRARPFMSPAFEKERPSMPERWRGTVSS